MPLKAKTTQQFIQEARKKHGDTYDYSLTDYLFSGTNVLITCSRHGPFYCTPNNHLHGKGGCRACDTEKKRKTTAQFVAECTRKHQHKYDYSQVVYINNKRKVTIICPEHGAFQQNALTHFRGSGCPSCRRAAQWKTQADFIAKATACHGNFYDYSESIYVYSHAHITIICPQHGAFQQKAVDHARGQGCQQCAWMKEHWTLQGWTQHQKERAALLYVVKLSGFGELFYKAGITFDSLKKRFAGRIPYQVEPLALFYSFDAASIWKAEKLIKKKLKPFKYLPDKPFDGRYECYKEAQPILNLLALETPLAPS